MNKVASVIGKSNQTITIISSLLIILFVFIQQMHGSGITSGADIPDTFQQHYLLAHHYLARADFNLAQLELDQAIARNPKSKNAHRDHCFVSLVQLNFPQALAELMMAVGLGQSIPLTVEEQAQLNKETAKLHYRKGLAYGNQKRFGREIFELWLANHYAPHDPAILRALAFALSECHYFPEAEKLYQESFSISPQTSTDDAFAYSDYAELLSQIGRKDEAIAELAKAIQIAPQVAALHVDMAWLLEAKGDYNKAANEIQLAIKTAPVLKPESQIEQPSINRIFKSMVNDSYKLRPGYANLWAYLGKLLDKQNKVNQAEEAYKHALLLDPQDGDTRNRLDELTKTHPANG